MEIRFWPNQYEVLSSDMNGLTCNGYQENFDIFNQPPIILWGLQLSSLIGNTATFTLGACRTQPITKTTYPYLPTPFYGSGYPGLIEILNGAETITLNPLNTTGFIVATYTISPNTTGANLYTVTGSLLQVTTIDATKQVSLASIFYNGSAWIITQNPISQRAYDVIGLGAIQYDLDKNVTIIGIPQGYTGNQINVNGLLTTNTDYFTPLSGAVITLVNNFSKINPAGEIATLKIDMPSSPVNDQQSGFCSSQVVAALTFGGSPIIGTPPTSLGIGIPYRYIFDSVVGAWFPM